VTCGRATRQSPQHQNPMPRIDLIAGARTKFPHNPNPELIMRSLSWFTIQSLTTLALTDYRENRTVSNP
jgi:hypothetical protein